MSNDCIDAKAGDYLALIQRDMKPEPLFYIPVPGHEDEAAGPYDLVQMAGLLRQKIITTETPTRLEGEQEWKPFGDRHHFIVAKEMPPDAVSTRVIALTEAARASRSPIPLPSAEFLVKLGVMAVAMLLAGGISFFLAWVDQTMGIFLVVAGGCAALLGVAMIYVTMADESNWTICLVFFIPFFNLYYFLANFEKYLPYFYLEYLGLTIALAATAGMAVASSSHG